MCEALHFDLVFIQRALTHLPFEFLLLVKRDTLEVHIYNT